MSEPDGHESTATLRKFLPGMYIVRASDLRKLHGVLSEFVGAEPLYTVETSDELQRRMALDGVCSYENPRDAEILSIHMDARRGLSPQKASVHFDPSDKAAWVYLVGEEEQVALLSKRLMGILSGMKAWFSIVDTVKRMLLWVFIGLGAIAGYVTVALLFDGIDIDQASSSRESPKEALLNGALIFIAWTGVTSVALRIRRHLLPVVTFAIGQGDDRFRVQEKLRWMAITFILTGLLGPIVSFFLR